MERRSETGVIKSIGGLRATPLISFVIVVALHLLGANALLAQSPLTFNYFYDDLGQLKKVVDSTGVGIDYVYDLVGNIVEVKRSSVAPGALRVFSFTPVQGGPFSTVTIQGQGFSSTATANTVKFNGVTATVFSASSTSLRVSVPIGATSGPISVNVGDSTATSAERFTALASPAITSVQPKAVARAVVSNIQVTGVNLTGATFAFVPGFVPAAISLASVVVNAAGTSATLSLTANKLGIFTLVATNTAGGSDAFSSASNRVTVVDLDSTVDTDGDGWPDALELLLGSDPADPNSVPNLNASGQVDSATISVLNTAQPVNPPMTQATDSSVFSVLNNALPVQPLQVTADSSVFSVLNNTLPLQPTQVAADSAIMSVLNVAATSAPSTVEADSVTFSVLNQTAMTALNTEALRANEGSSKSRSAIDVVPIIRGLGRNSSILEGETIMFQVDPSSGNAVQEVEFFVNGASFGSYATAPYEFVFTVPAGADRLAFGARVKESDGTVREAATITIPVVADPLTVVSGRVADQGGRPIEGAQIDLLMSGLRAEFFDYRDPLTQLPELPKRTADRVSFASAVNLRNPELVFGNDPFGVGMAPDYAARLSGWIKIDQPGTYEFFLGADEGARLILDGVTVMDIPHGKGELQEMAATLSLPAGLIPIEILYYESVGNAELQLSYRPPGGERRVVPPSMLLTDGREFSTVTDRDGIFSLMNVPSAVASVKAVLKTRGETIGQSNEVHPLTGGSTDLGIIRVRQQSNRGTK